MARLPQRLGSMVRQLVKLPRLNPFAPSDDYLDFLAQKQKDIRLEREFWMKVQLRVFEAALERRKHEIN